MMMCVKFLNHLVPWTLLISIKVCIYSDKEKKIRLNYIFIDPETGRSKGFGFIQYKNGEDAKQALEKMNGFELAGRNVKL